MGDTTWNNMITTYILLAGVMVFFEFVALQRVESTPVSLDVCGIDRIIFSIIYKCMMFNLCVC